MSNPLLIHFKESDSGQKDLIYTLRSLQNYVSELLIVGDKPSMLDPEAYSFVPFSNPYRRNKDANILKACIAGCVKLQNDGLSGDVIIASDDCVALKPYHEGIYLEQDYYSFMRAFPKRFARNPWWERPYQSMLFLAKAGKWASNAEAHVPQTVSIKSVMQCIDAPIGEIPLGAKTLIVGNDRHLDKNRPSFHAPTLKIHPDQVHLVGDTKDGVTKHRFCNWSTATPELHERLEVLFPTPSRFEHAN